jgi:hypothetical protein
MHIRISYATGMVDFAPLTEIISNNPSFRLKHPGVLDGSYGSDGTSYPLTKNYMLPVAQATGRASY